MAIVLSGEDVRKQSEQVFSQFGNKWKLFARFNNKLERKNVNELRNTGIGKYLLMVAMGESLEGHIEMIKKYRDRFDICTCDKGFGTLLEHGIKADYVVICDCNIPFRWFKKYVDQTEGVKLISTLYASPRWTSRWKGDKYFFVNRDAIKTEKNFVGYFKPEELRTIPAGSNVSNAMVCFWTGSDENQNVNWGGYEKYILTGYDYSWRHDGNYYAFANPTPKRYYMNHHTIVDIAGTQCLSSTNLMFSAKWLYSYVTTFGLPVVNCSGRGILDINKADMKETLESLTADKRMREACRAAFEVAKQKNIELQKAEEEFQKSRRLLYARN